MNNEYDDLLASEGTQDEARTTLRASVIGALPTNPDQYAEAKRLARTTGVPAPVVERNMDEVKKQATLNEYDALIERAPVTASKFQNPEFAKVAHDERDQLADLEDFIKRAPGGEHDTSTSAALKRGVVQLGVLGEAMGYGLDRMLTTIGKRFLPEPRVPGGEVDATSGQVKASLVEVANLYSNLPRDKRTDFMGEIVNRAAAEGKTLRGVADAIQYIATPGGAMGALNYLIEMAPTAVVGGGVGGLAAKPVVAKIASQAVARGVTTAAVAGVGTTTNAFPAELAGQINEGKDVDEAMGYAGTKATVEGLVNAPFGFAGGALPLGATLAGKVGNITAQAGLQGVGGAAGATAAAASVGEEITPGEQFLEAFFEFASAPSDIAIAAAADVAERRNATKAQVDQATASADHLTRILQAAEASKTRVRDPETFAQLVQDAAEASGTAPTEVFIDAQPLVDTLQKAGMTEAQIREALPSVAEQLGDEYDAGGSVAIPIGEAVAAFAGTGAEADLVRFARTTEDGYSVADSEQALAALDEMDADAQRIIAEQQDAEAWMQSAKVVEDTIFTQLDNAGRFSSDVNRTYATILRNYYVTQADVMGITPEELYRQFPLTASGVAPTGQVLNQPGGGFKSQGVPEGLDQIESFRDEIYHAAKSAGYEVSWGDSNVSNSRYVSVEVPGSEYGDTVTIRFSDHYAKPDYRSTDQFTVDTYTGRTFEDAIAYLKEKGIDLTSRSTTFDQEVKGTTPYTDEELDFLVADGSLSPEQAASLKATAKSRGQNADARTASATGRTQQADARAGRAGEVAGRTVAGTAPRSGWEAATAVRGADGKPARIFRGSIDGAVTPDNFNPEQFGKASGYATSGLGVFFSTWHSDAQKYADDVGGQVGSFFLDIRNPRVITSDQLPEFDSVEQATEFREALRALGHDGIAIDYTEVKGPVQMVAFDPEQVILPGDEVLYQSGIGEEPRDLYVGHNITAEKIRHALDLGGLPAPSLGISRTTTGGFEGFGDITLLAPKEILESDGARTFNADVYSPRQPRPVYKPDPKKFDALLEKLRALPGGFSVADIDEVGRYGADALARSDAVKLLYLTEIGQAPKLKRQKVPAEIKKAAKLGLRTEWQMRDDSRIRALAKQSYEAMFAEYAKIDLPADEVARLRSRYFEDDGEVTFNLLTEFARKVSRYVNENGVDTGALRQDIAKKLRTSAQSDAFEKWVKDLAAPLLGDKKLELSPSRRVPYTLDNVTAQMIKELRGGEGFNYGAGNIRAMVAAELDSVQAVQNRRGEIVSGADMKKAKEESQQRLSDTLDDLKPFYKYDANGWGYMDDASRAIAEGPKGWREAFKINAESEKIIRDYISYVNNLPTEYFETKMQRSVDLSEFTVAIVPKGTPQDVVAALEAKGLAIKVYDPKKPDSRIKAIKAADADNNVLFQSASSSWYFSPLVKAVEGIKQETAPAAQWLATITKQPGVKPDELEWTGLPEFLRVQQGKVTKAQILNYLSDNGVQVEEVMKGGDSDRNAEIKRAFNAAGYDLEVDTLNEEIEYTDSNGEPVEFDDLPQELQDVVNANVDVDGAKGATRYDNYVLPGGDNYRELLLTLPAPDRPATIDEVANRMFGQSPESLDDFQRGMVENEMVTVKGGANVPGYRSSHWHEANILAHVRFDERTDADGKRVLFINEIQSDWGQEGKKKGFSDPAKKARHDELRAKWLADTLTDEEGVEFDRLGEQYTASGIPAAPFVTKTDAWVALAIKRMVRYAAENGFDRVAFINGQQSADLYALSKQVESVEVVPASDDLYDIRVVLLDGGTRNLNGKTAQEVEDSIGKDLATKAIGAADQWRDANRKYREALKRDDVPESDLDTLRAERDAIETEFTDLDLNVGGEGMRTFYDKIVPKVAKDVLKKLGGGGLTTVGIPSSSAFDKFNGYEHGVLLWTFDSRAAADRWAQDVDGRSVRPAGENLEQLGFDITPAMREAALQGLSLFQSAYQNQQQNGKAEARGSFNPTTLNIALLEKADLSTFLHETGHFFFEMQATIAARPDAPARIVDDVNTLLKAVGFEGTAAEWLAQPLNARRESHEKVAESFEQYLITGEAPTVELQGLFNQMRAWMLAVYKTLKQFFAVNKRAGMTAEVAGVFDRMLASDAAIAETKRVRAMSPLFKSAEAAGMDATEWAAYQDNAGQMDADARRDLDARQVRDMKWLRSARSKALKALQADASAKRREARIEARRRLLQEPVYRAMQFLRGKVEQAPVEKKAKGLDTRRDDLLTAIAKLGGLNKDLVVAEWGIDPKDFAKSPVFGKPILRSGKAGLSPDGMAEALAEVGYLQPKDGDRYALSDLEAMLDDSARGIQHYSLDADYDLIHGYKTLPVAADLGEQPFAAGRLSRPDLEVRFANSDVDWQKLGVGRRGMIAEVGMDADAVANIVGFNTGEEMVKALLAAESLHDATEALTDQIMLERHGDITSPEGLQRAADAALANDAHAKLLATEYARLNKAVGSPRAVQMAAKEAAERMVDRQAVRLARPDKSTAAAARAGKAAEKAHAAGNLDEAAGFKRNQILNTAIARAQRELRAFVEKAQGDFANMFGKDDQRAKTRDMNLVNLARAALAQYGLAPQAGGMKALQYLDRVADYDPTLAENLKSMLAAMPEGEDFRDLTAGEFRTVANLVRGMWEMSRGVKQITIDGKKVEIDAAADELVAAVLTNNGGEQGTLPGYSGTTTTADDLRVGALGIKSMLTRVEQWADFMGPAFKRFIWQPVSEAVTRYRVRRNEMVKQYRDLLKAIEPDLTFHKIHAPELGMGGFTFNAGKTEVLHAILHSGNQSNLRKLLLGPGYQNPAAAWATVDEAGNLDTSRWDAFVKRMAAEGVITRADMDFVQGVWDLLETVKGDAQKAHRELYGYYFNEVTATPFVDPFGVERRGGYVPALADGLSSPDAMQKREQEELLHAGNSFMFPSTGKGFTQARVEYNRPLELDLRSIGSHLDKVTRFAYIEPAVRDVGKILLNKRVSRALNGYDQTIISQMLNPWLQRAARQTVSTPGKNRWADKFFNGLRSRSGVVIMFANVVNTLQQITGFSVAALKVPAPALLRAAYMVTRDPKRMAAEAAALSLWLAERLAGPSFEMQQEIKNILVNPNPVVKGNEFLKHNAYFMQQAMQNMMDLIIWWGAYDNAVANGANQRDAIRASDEAVRTTQGTFAPEDVSAFESNTAFVRLFTQFYGYFNMLANTLGTEAKKAIRDMGYGAATPRLLFIWFAGLALPAVVAEIIARGLPDDEDDEDGDGTLDEWLALFFGSQGRTLAAMVPGAGQAASLAVNLTDDKVYNDRLSISPGMSMAETTIRGGVNLLQGEVFDERLTKSEVRDTLTLIGMATGAPTGAVARSAGYMVDVENGKADPDGPVDYAVGLTTGR